MSNFPRIRDRKEFDLSIDPPPDLAVEIEISRTALERLPIYVRLGVPEVWRFDGEQLVIHRLQPDGQYQTTEESGEIPAITPAEIVHWVREGEAESNRFEWSLRLREWVREELIQRFLMRRENV